MDLTQDTVAAGNLIAPNTAHGADGEAITGTASAGSAMNTQVYAGYAETNATDYTATSVSITVSKAGTYKCSWTGLRNTTGGTSGSRLYKNENAVGSAHTSGWIRSYGQYCEETLTLDKDDVLTVYARARSATYYMVVGNLIISQIS